jgi:hypothetical protein
MNNVLGESDERGTGNADEGKVINFAKSRTSSVPFVMEKWEGNCGILRFVVVIVVVVPIVVVHSSFFIQKIPIHPLAIFLLFLPMANNQQQQNLEANLSAEARLAVVEIRRELQRAIRRLEVNEAAINVVDSANHRQEQSLVHQRRNGK